MARTFEFVLHFVKCDTVTSVTKTGAVTKPDYLLRKLLLKSSDTISIMSSPHPTSSPSHQIQG